MRDFHEAKSQIINGASNDEVTRKGLTDNEVTLEKLVEYAKTLEMTNIQQKEMCSAHSAQAAGEGNVNAVNHGFRKHPYAKKKSPM